MTRGSVLLQGICLVGFGLCGVALTGCPVPSMEVPDFYGPHDVAVYADGWLGSEYEDSAPVYVFYPTEDGEKVKSAGKPWPVVVFAPGFNTPAFIYGPYGQQIASWGFIVHIAHYTGFDNGASTEAMCRHVDWLLEQNELAGGPFEGMIDEARIGCAGHSMGGKYVVMACIEDDRFRTGVAIDPVDGAADFGDPNPLFPSITPERMDEVDEPILYVGTTHDSVFSPGHENYHEFFMSSTAYAQEIVFLVGDHASFLGNPIVAVSGILHYPFGSTGEFDALLRNYTIRYAVAWLKVHLEGDTSFETYLTGAEAQQDVADGWIAFSTRN